MPGQPAAPTIESVNETAITVTIQPAAFTGGMPIEHYKLRWARTRVEAGRCTWQSLS